MKEVNVRLTFLEECLGTASANPELYREFIASNRDGGVAEDEVAALPTVDEELQKAMTVFSREGNAPILWDYQIKGFFKDSCSALSRCKESKEGAKDGTLSSKLTAFKKVIDGTIFVGPRKIILNLPEGGTIGVCERPLRAQTAQGERIALARSETVPAGTWMDFTITLLQPAHLPLVKEWLDYGKFRGLGQWRNSGKGKFSYAME